MAITSSAKKAIRASARKRVLNIRRKRAIEAIVKDIRVAVAEKKSAELSALLSKAYAAVDKAAKSHFIHPNNAAHAKSRIAILVRDSVKK